VAALGAVDRSPVSDHFAPTLDDGPAYRPFQTEDLPPRAVPRLELLLEIARRYRASFSVAELIDLLPVRDAITTERIRQWVADHPALARVEGDRILPADGPDLLERARRTERGTRRRELAQWIAGRILAPVLPFVRCLGVSGSTAYGEPQAADDLDFVLITQRGSLWVVLAYIYLATRVYGRPEVDGRVKLCWNLALDESDAGREFGAGRGLLFAREASSVRVLQGGAYYRELLRRAPAVQAELPRISSTPVSREPPRGPAAPWPVRALNLVLYPVLAGYAQLACLRDNARARRRGDPGEISTARSTLGTYTRRSEAFAQLGRVYERTRDAVTLT
jgi:hypothetical protein